MMEPDWGVSEPPHSFGSDGWLNEPVHSDQAEDVPEVIAARAHGYHPPPDNPLWCFLPAIWPRMARAWVRDSRVRRLTRRSSHGPSERLPWTAADYGEYEDDTNALLAELGLPARPAGRIWLLQVPQPYATVQDVLDDIWRNWLASGGLATATPELVEYAHGRLRAIF